MRTPFDQFQKALLTAFLELVGSVTAEREVASQVQAIDLWFDPDSRAARDTRLGLLGGIAASGPCLLECFSSTPGPSEVDACIRKQLVVHQDLALRSKREGRSSRPAKPALWLISAGRPERVLREYQAVAAADWPVGVWRTRRVDAMYLVVVRDLPRTPDTLLLRFLGRGTTLRDAVTELVTQSPDSWLHAVATPLVVAFQNQISHTDSEADDMQYLRQLRAEYDLWERKVRDEGHKQGRDEGHKQGRDEGHKQGRDEGLRQALGAVLAQRFGAVPPSTAERIRRAGSHELETWLSRVVAAATLDDVFYNS